MKKPDYAPILLTVISILLIASLSGCSASSKLVNLGRAKRDLSFYYESGQYHDELKSVVTDAIESFERMRIKDSSAVIFDVDETAISNYEIIKSVDFGYVAPMWNKWINSAKAPAIEEVRELYNRLLQRGAHIIFITAREKEYYAATYKNLTQAGYIKFDTLITRSDVSRDIPAGVFKSIERIVIASLGYEIIGCVGDQPSDFQGGYTGLQIKIPNYLYLVD